MAPYLDTTDLAPWIYATVTLRLDYCDVLYFDHLSKSIWKLQLVQYAVVY